MDEIAAALPPVTSRDDCIALDRADPLAALRDKITALIGARAGEVIVADSTSLNLFKSLSAAVALQRRDAPTRSVILSERGNFPTDLYIAESIAASHGLELRLADGARIAHALADDVAVLMLTHVNYRSGRMHRLAETTRAPPPTSRSAAATST